MPQNLRQVSSILSQIAQSDEAKPKKSDFDAPKDVKSESEKIRTELLRQKLGHRDQLLSYIRTMASASLIFLVFIILAQMIIRIFKPTYTGVSDTVINIITVGVFGQVIGIVAAIVVAVWKEPDKDS